MQDNRFTTENKKRLPVPFIIFGVIVCIIILMIAASPTSEKSLEEQKQIVANINQMTGNTPPPTQEPSSSPSTIVEEKLVYKELPSYSKDGVAWRNIAIPANTNKDSLFKIVADLNVKNPGQYFRLFDSDDMIMFKKYRDWDVNYPSERYPYPEEWGDTHYIGTIQKMLDMGSGEMKWVFYREKDGAQFPL